MSLVINTNVASLNSQRQLMNSGGALDKATERLSSGLRINSAKDDAAGLAISNRMTSQVRGLDQAIRNANDGVSLIQTAEGALQETTNILQRMRELSIQAGNGIYTDADRKTLDAEVQQLTAELNRIALSTSFNGQNLLDGTLGQVKLQVGADANQTITMKIPKMDAKTLGMGSTGGDVTGDHLGQSISATSFKDGDILINGKSIGAFDGTKTPPDTFEKLLKNISEKIEGIEATAFNEVTSTTVGTGVTTAAAPITIGLINPDGTTSSFTISNTNNMDELIAAINTQSGGLVQATKTETGLVTLANDNGATMTVSGAGASVGLGAIASPSYGQIALTSKTGEDILVTQGPNAKQTTTATGANLPSGELDGGTLTINGVSITVPQSPEVSGLNAPGATVGATGNLVVGSNTYSVLTGNTVDDVVATINLTSATSGIRAVNGGGGANGNLQLFDANNNAITISATSTAGVLTGLGLQVGTFVDPAELVGGNFPAATIPAGGYGNIVIGANTYVVDATNDTTGEIVALINADSATTGIYARNGGTANGNLELFTATGVPVVIGATSTPATLTAAGLTAGTFSTAGDNFSDLITAINAVSLSTGVTATNGGGGTYGNLQLTDTKGRDINISGSSAAVLTSLGLTSGATKPQSLLSALGFQETRNQATVFGTHIPVVDSVKSLAFGDLTINGVTVSGENTSTLQGKIDNINKLSDDTGVIASLKSESVSTFNKLKLTTEVTGASLGGTANAIGDTLSINGIQVAMTGTTIAQAVVDINNASPTTGVTAFIDVNSKLHLFSDGQINIANGTTNGAAVTAYLGLTAAVAAGTPAGSYAPSAATTGSVRLNNTQISLTNVADLTTVISEINAQQASTGVFGSIDSLGQLVLTSNSAFTIDVGDTQGAKTLATLGLDTSLAGPIGGRVTNVLASIQLDSLSNSPISLDVTENGSLVTGLMSQNKASAGLGFGSSINSISIATQAGAQKAIGVIDKALDTINDVRSQLGAINNRLEFTVNNLANVSEKTSASRSRITDADFAAETAAMSRAQVLQQAATAMLAQSNARPKEVLSLLR